MSPQCTLRWGAADSWARLKCPHFLLLSAGRLEHGHPAQSPVGVDSSLVLSTACPQMGLVARKLLRKPSVLVYLGSPLPHRPATCSAVQSGVWIPGER